MDEDGAAKFKSVVYLPINILNGVSYAAMAVGSLLILVVIIFVIVFLVRRKEQVCTPRTGYFIVDPTL